MSISVMRACAAEGEEGSVMTEETIAPSRAQLISPASWREAFSKQLQQEQEQEMELEQAHMQAHMQAQMQAQSQAEARESRFTQESGQRELRAGENATDQFQAADELQSDFLFDMCSS